MRKIRLFILLLCLIFTSPVFSQISHGGTPYFLQPSLLATSSVLRAASEPFFIEMPSFDLDSVLREDAVNEENMRGSLRFAHKFYTHIDSNDGIKTVLPDGTTVLQIGIHSAGAYSINLLLSDFELPPGGKLFVYNADHSYVAGSFDERNNSADKLLPIRPVAGDSIIIEYSEPANVPFTGHFVISEVNHDYRDILRTEPGKDVGATFFCMPDVLCSDASAETIRSTVLLIINGNTLCTGVLLNNTADDGKTYVLTAVHCFIDNADSDIEFTTDMSYYDARAGTTIAFFNYTRPDCDANIKINGTEEMSVASASTRVVLPRKDIALLEFFDSIPNYFNAYYAGWNCDLTGNGTTHTNIHHPNGAVKKYGMTDGAISLETTFPIFDSNSFWKVPYWTIGSTAAGSSGSPLFDENKLVIGGLSSGTSYCNQTLPNGNSDYFSSLGKGWVADSVSNQLKTYLDPQNTGVTQYPGKDPNQLNPVIRLANADYTKGDSLITSVLNSPNNGYVFGNSNLQTLEFAEKYAVDNPVGVIGAYLLVPAMPFASTSSVMVSIYSGDSFPEVKIDSTRFIPQYVNYSSNSFSPANKTMTLPTETFVVFAKPVPVMTTNFFISYSINYSTTAQFCVYNTKFQNVLQPNTAWVKSATGWVSADAYGVKPMKTSLAIQPVVRRWSDEQIETVTPPDSIGFYYDRSGKALTFRKPLDTQGLVSVYSVSGQLSEKIFVQPGQTSIILRERPKGTIGIVKITSDNYSAVGKFMY